MPSYQVNDGSESYGRNGSYNNYGYRQETSGGTAMRERDLDNHQNLGFDSEFFGLCP